MKKIQFLFAAAALVLASCSNEEYLGDNGTPEALQNAKMIGFSAVSNATTRATLVGAEAAAKLNNHFVVYGTKHAAAVDGTVTNDEVVFNQYNVEWGANTAGTTTTNSNNWEYVGKTPYGTAVTTQTAKYWDLNAVGYTFYAFSSSNISYPAAGTDLVSVTKTTSGTDVYAKGYTVTAKTGANLDNMYYADRLPVAPTNYGKPVTLTFRNFGSRVRVGFFETVPGYSVKIDRFYYAGSPSAVVTKYADMSTANTTNFAAALQNVQANAVSNSFNVTYYNATTSNIENRVKVTNNAATSQYTLTLGAGVVGTTLGTSATAPTWDQTGGAYTTVFPFEDNANPMLVRVDYTLTSDDGSGETIKVKNARVVVPTPYVQWKSNYAYTYIFKISDNTNGTTGTTPTNPDDPTTGSTEGLFPITFDAVVESATDNKQETVTAFVNNSITTYSTTSDVTVNREYKSGEDIYVVTESAVTKTAFKPTAVGTAAGNAQVYTATGTTITEATVKAQLNGLKNGITLTPVTAAPTVVAKVPMSDGTTKTVDAVKFTPAAAGTYVYVYTTTPYAAATYATAASATFNAATTYYFKTTDGVYYPSSGINADNFDANKANLYTQTAAGTVGVYDVKVINVK